jgi:hypothetical protein
MVAGTESAKIKTLHDKYGDVVRISPNCLSFCTSEAWRGMSSWFSTSTSLTEYPDIYAHKLGKAELEKDPENIFDLPGTTPDIIRMTLGIGLGYANLEKMPTLPTTPACASSSHMHSRTTRCAPRKISSTAIATN